jgi:hypothetical protein
MATEVLIGSDQLKLLEAVAEAASDLDVAKHDREFARLNGGVRKLERDLFERTNAYYDFMQANADDL